jgi:hypothetical protein
MKPTETMITIDLGIQDESVFHDILDDYRGSITDYGILINENTYDIQMQIPKNESKELLDYFKNEYKDLILYASIY